MTAVVAELNPIHEFLGNVVTLLMDSDVIKINAKPNGIVYVDQFRSGRRRYSTIVSENVERFLRWCGCDHQTGHATLKKTHSGNRASHRRYDPRIVYAHP